MQKQPLPFDPAEGQAFQGDVVLMALPDDFPALSTALPIKPRKRRLVLVEGEATGHHHAIQPFGGATLFRDDAIARDLEATVHAPPAAPAKARPADGRSDAEESFARLYEDRNALRELIRRDLITSDRLCVGFLVVSGGPVVLTHQEHDPILIPPGRYYVGRQQEFVGRADREETARRVQD